jgi:hypothetical protein
LFMKNRVKTFASKRFQLRSLSKKMGLPSTGSPIFVGILDKMSIVKCFVRP